MSAALIFARQALSAFVLEQAARVSKEMGFSWVAVESGMPEDYDSLVNEVGWCQATGRAFRVWSGGSDHTIYSFPSVNHAFRFWHDMMHYRGCYKMDYEDEVRLGLQTAKVVADRFGTDSLEYKLFVADTIGQSTHHALTGQFPENQLAFALNLIGIKS